MIAHETKAVFEDVRQDLPLEQRFFPDSSHKKQQRLLLPKSRRR